MKHIATTKYYDGEKLQRSVCTKKQRILKFLNSVPFDCAAAGYFNDVITGELMESISWVGYESGQWFWDSQDIYHFEKYDLELDPEFIQYALEH